jgi:branched-chain amino acid transport system substrate-binding protein
MMRTRKPGISRRTSLALMGAGAVTFAVPWAARAQAKTIKIGMPTILSGRVAQLRHLIAQRGGAEVDKITPPRRSCWSAADRNGDPRSWADKPQEAARAARESSSTPTVVNS